MRKLKNEELDRLTVSQYKSASKQPVVIVLDNVRSMNNIGSIFRTADAFRVEAIYLCGITGKPPHREIHKTALGATESVPWSYFEKTSDAIGDLRKRGFRIVSVEQAEGAIPLEDFKVDTSEKLGIIFGNEIRGIDQTIVSSSDICIVIPQFGTKHSFNISVSAGIILWEVVSQLKGNKKSGS